MSAARSSSGSRAPGTIAPSKIRARRVAATASVAEIGLTAMPLTPRPPCPGESPPGDYSPRREPSGRGVASRRALLARENRPPGDYSQRREPPGRDVASRRDLLARENRPPGDYSQRREPPGRDVAKHRRAERERLHAREALLATLLVAVSTLVREPLERVLQTGVLRQLEHAKPQCGAAVQRTLPVASSQLVDHRFDRRVPLHRRTVHCLTV